MNGRTIETNISPPAREACPGGKKPASLVSGEKGGIPPCGVRTRGSGAIFGLGRPNAPLFIHQGESDPSGGKENKQGQDPVAA